MILGRAVEYGWRLTPVPSENLIRVDSAMTENRIMILDDENMVSISVDLVLQSVQVGTAA